MDYMRARVCVFPSSLQGHLDCAIESGLIIAGNQSDSQRGYWSNSCVLMINTEAGRKAGTEEVACPF